jgi:hypothetical protein
MPSTNSVRPIDKPIFTAALVDSRGYVSTTWLPWFNALRLSSVATSGNNAAIAALEGGLALTEAQLAALTARVDTDEATLAAQQLAVSALQTLTNALAVTSQAHTRELNNHEARLEALETYKNTWATKDVAADYTIVYADFTLRVDATAAAVTITLPAAAALVDGEYHNVKKVDATLHAVTIDGNGKTIDGASSIELLLPEWSLGLQWDAAADSWGIF